MRSDNLLSRALTFLGAAMLICLGGIIGLSAASDRPIPDVLIATTGTIVGAFATLLVGTLRGDTGGTLVINRGEHRRDDAGYGAIELAIGVVVLLILVALLLRLI